MSGKSDGAASFCRNDFAKRNDFLAMLSQARDGRVRLFRIKHGHHANAAIKRPQHFLFANVPRRGQPFEYRQDLNAIELQAHGKSGRQDARAPRGLDAAALRGRRRGQPGYRPAAA